MSVPVSLLLMVVMLCATIVLVVVLRHWPVISRRAPAAPGAFTDLNIGVAALVLAVLSTVSLVCSSTQDTDRDRTPGTLSAATERTTTMSDIIEAFAHAIRTGQPWGVSAFVLIVLALIMAVGSVGTGLFDLIKRVGPGAKRRENAADLEARLATAHHEQRDTEDHADRLERENAAARELLAQVYAVHEVAGLIPESLLQRITALLRYAPTSPAAPPATGGVLTAADRATIRDGRTPADAGPETIIASGGKAGMD